jgi:Ca2+-dependent lipid-binding protein
MFVPEAVCQTETASVLTAIFTTRYWQPPAALMTSPRGYYSHRVGCYAITVSAANELHGF